MPGIGAGHYGMAGNPHVVNNANVPRVPTNEDYGIREVWKHNLEEEFDYMRRVVQKYKYVAMDTEFPGVVAKPIGEFISTLDYQYQMLRCNVDLLKIIQLGLSFFNEEGELAPGASTFQFNFEFSLGADMYAQDSIDLLTKSGLKFDKHQEDGINPTDFAELMMTSGLVTMDDVKFLSFHSGYDFGYLLKLLTDAKLPEEESKFFETLCMYFPTIYDVKYLMKSCKNLKGGLQEVSEQLELERIGPQHQAGSDSLLTGHTFFKMRELYFEGHIDYEKYCGHLYGLGTQHVQNGNDITAGQSPPIPAVPVGGAAAPGQGAGGPSGAPVAVNNTNSNANNTPTNAVDGNCDNGNDGVVNDNGHDGK